MAQADAIVVKLLKDGNKEVFESVYDRYFGLLFTYCLQYVISRETAKEMVQDTFLKLWEVSESLKSDTNLQSFLYRIARNNCLNYLKHLKVEQKYLSYTKYQQAEISLNKLALGHSDSEKIISEELEEKINRTIESLPPKCREVFEMSRYNNIKYKEIAAELNISVKTVENQIHKALKILRENLTGFRSILLLLLFS